MSRRKGICNCGNIESENICVADHGLHLLDIVTHLPDPVTIESQLIQSFKHVRMHQVALESDMIVMPYKVRFAGKHLHQKVVTSCRRIHVEIDLRIYTHRFYYPFAVCMRIILREGKIMCTSDDHYWLIVIIQFSDYSLQGSIGIINASSCFHISGVGELERRVPVIKFVEFMTNNIRRIAVSLNTRTSLLRATDNYYVGL